MSLTFFFFVVTFYRLSQYHPNMESQNDNNDDDSEMDIDEESSTGVDKQGSNDKRKYTTWTSEMISELLVLLEQHVKLSYCSSTGNYGTKNMKHLNELVKKLHEKFKNKVTLKSVKNKIASLIEDYKSFKPLVSLSGSGTNVRLDPDTWKQYVTGHPKAAKWYDSKLEKAKLLGVEVIDEAELLRRVGQTA